MTARQALERLVQAVADRDNNLGDPIRHLICVAALRQAMADARAVLDERK